MKTRLAMSMLCLVTQIIHTVIPVYCMRAFFPSAFWDILSSCSCHCPKYLSTSQGPLPPTSSQSLRTAFRIRLSWHMVQPLAAGSTSLSVAPKPICTPNLQSIPRWLTFLGRFCWVFDWRWLKVQSDDARTLKDTRPSGQENQGWAVHVTFSSVCCVCYIPNGRFMTMVVSAACSFAEWPWAVPESWTRSSMWTSISCRRQSSPWGPWVGDGWWKTFSTISVSWSVRGVGNLQVSKYALESREKTQRS